MDKSPEDIIALLGSFDNVELSLKEEPGDWSGMFWRFLDAADEDVEVMISRDTDSSGDKDFGVNAFSVRWNRTF